MNISRKGTKQEGELKCIEKKIRGRCALVKFKRDDKLNAINDELVEELSQTLKELDENIDISTVILYGNDKAFAAGADISEMHRKRFSEAYQEDFLEKWSCVAKFSKPIIAAVSGYALGGGLEIALSCDIIYAAENAQLGQPEVGLGIIPGCGGTQRLVRTLGKSKAMEICLGAVPITAEEAYQFNLVSKVFPNEELLGEAVKLAEKISRYSLPILRMIKETINFGLNSNLSQGLQFERRMFHSTFALSDSYEGIEAFLDRRAAAFKNK